jgi:hypothetical protein
VCDILAKYGFKRKSCKNNFLLLPTSENVSIVKNNIFASLKNFVAIAGAVSERRVH